MEKGGIDKPREEGGIERGGIERAACCLVCLACFMKIPASLLVERFTDIVYAT